MVVYKILYSPVVILVDLFCSAKVPAEKNLPADSFRQRKSASISHMQIHMHLAV